MTTELALGRLRAAFPLYHAGNYTAAERLLRESLAADPELASSHILLAWTYYSQGESRAALEAANAAVALEPNGDAFRVKAMALHQLRQFRPALEAAREAARLSPNNALVAETHAMTLEGVKDWQAAEAEYVRATQLAPDTDYILAALGHFLLRRYRLSEAELVAARINAASDDTTVLLLRGQIALRRHRGSEAQDYALWVLSQSATHAAALRLLVEAKACRSFWLGLWWRYTMLFTKTKYGWWRLAVLVPILLALALGTGGFATPIFIYFYVSSVIFDRMVKKELKDRVRLNKTF